MPDVELHDHYEYEFDLTALAAALARNPQFIIALRNALLMDARTKGNSMGQWAQQTNAAPQLRRLS